MARYYVTDAGDRYDEDELQDLLDHLADPENFEDTDAFDEYINENQNEIVIMGYGFEPAKVLYEMDENAYYDALHEYAENEAEYYADEYRRTLQNMDDGDEEWLGNIKVTCHDEEDDEDENDEDDAPEEAEAVPFFDEDAVDPELNTEAQTVWFNLMNELYTDNKITKLE
jgi:hypothetical protein